MIKDDPLLQHESPEATLAAQLAYVDQLDFHSKGNEDLCNKRIFTASELQYFEAALLMYADMSWPLDFRQIQSMMRSAASHCYSSSDCNEPERISSTYVREFVRNSPRLLAAKTANIDPLRAKKATLKVACSLAIQQLVMASCILLIYALLVNRCDILCPRVM